MMATAATTDGRGLRPGRGISRSSSLLLLLLGFITISLYCAAGDEESANTVRPHGYIRQGSNTADYSWSAFRDKHNAGELEPLARVPGEDSAGSSHIRATGKSCSVGEVDG